MGLYQAAEMLRLAGYDPYAFRGPRGQSLEMATRYYGPGAGDLGSPKTVRAVRGD